MKCPVCEKENDDSARYCRNCGLHFNDFYIENEIKPKSHAPHRAKIILIVFLVAILLSIFFILIPLIPLSYFGPPYARTALVMMVLAFVTIVFLVLGFVFKDTKKQFLLINFATSLMPLSLTLLVLMYYVSFIGIEMNVHWHAFLISMIVIGSLTTIAFIVNGITGLKLFETRPKPFKIVHLSLSIFGFVLFITALIVALIRMSPYPSGRTWTAIIFVIIVCLATYAMGVVSSYFIDRKVNKD